MYNTEKDPRFEVKRVSGEDLLELGVKEDHKDNEIIPQLDYFIVVRKTTECSNIVPVKDYADHISLRFWVEVQCAGTLLEFSKTGLEKGEYSSIHEILEKTDSVLNLFVKKEWWELAASFRDEIKETKEHYSL
jgi:hypothetical protein